MSMLSACPSKHGDSSLDERRMRSLLGGERPPDGGSRAPVLRIRAVELSARALQQRQSSGGVAQVSCHSEQVSGMRPVAP